MFYIFLWTKSLKSCVYLCLKHIWIPISCVSSCYVWLVATKLDCTGLRKVARLILEKVEAVLWSSWRNCWGARKQLHLRWKTLWKKGTVLKRQEKKCSLRENGDVTASCEDITDRAIYGPLSPPQHWPQESCVPVAASCWAVFGQGMAHLGKSTNH